MLPPVLEVLSHTEFGNLVSAGSATSRSNLEGSDTSSTAIQAGGFLNLAAPLAEFALHVRPPLENQNLDQFHSFPAIQTENEFFALSRAVDGIYFRGFHNTHSVSEIGRTW